MIITIIYPTEPSYVFGLIDGLSKINNLEIYLIGTDRTSKIENRYKNVTVLNFRGDQSPNVGRADKIKRIFNFYFRLFRYTIKSKSNIFHIHWANKFFFFDSTILNLFYKLTGKKIVYTAHNIDQGMRDNNTNSKSILGYKILYKIVDHIIVHNNHSKKILLNKFNLSESKISINKLGLNIIAVKTGLTKKIARDSLNINKENKVVLFFGGINPYKGLDLLIDSFSLLVKEDSNYRLIIAGQPRDKEYFKLIQSKIEKDNIKKFCFTFFEFIPDEDVERFFIAADCCVLPYKFIFQSGVHALSFAFGLPVIATDVGSFKEEDIIEGMNGYVCKPDDVIDLKNTILKYFNSDLYRNLSVNRNLIKQWAEDTYSWDKIGTETFNIYKKVLNK